MLFGSALEALGYGLRRRITGPSLGIVDGLAGAVLSTGVALGLVWLAGSVVLQAPQARGLRDDIQRSSILRALNDALPPSGPILNALARFDPFPRIDGPPVDLPAPRAAIARDPDVRLAARGVVKIQGTACGLGVEGSGWVARDGIVVTNAHVVAGQDDTTVQLGGSGPSLAARRSSSTPATTSPSCACEGLGGRALPHRRRSAQRRLGGDPRLPGERPVRRPGRRASGPRAR